MCFFQCPIRTPPHSQCLQSIFTESEFQKFLFTFPLDLGVLAKNGTILGVGGRVPELVVIISQLELSFSQLSFFLESIWGRSFACNWVLPLQV